MQIKAITWYLDMFNLTSIIQTGDLFVFIIYLLFPGLHIFSFDLFFHK